MYCKDYKIDLLFLKWSMSAVFGGQWVRFFQFKLCLMVFSINELRSFCNWLYWVFHLDLEKLEYCFFSCLYIVSSDFSKLNRDKNKSKSPNYQ